MALKWQRACAWSGIVAIVSFAIALIMNGFIIPPSPDESAVDIWRMFDQHRTMIRIGDVIGMFAAALLVPWGVSMQQQLRRAGGADSPWGYVVSICMGIFSLEFIYLIMFWQVAAFRQDNSPELVRFLFDMGWIPFVGISSTAVILSVALGIGIVSDQHATPVFPRWLGWFNLWAAFMFTPGTLNVFFHSGPLAYNGLLAWYIPVCVFAIWSILNTLFVVTAIKNQEAQEASHSASNGQRRIDVDDLARELAELREELAKRPVAGR